MKNQEETNPTEDEEGYREYKIQIGDGGVVQISINAAPGSTVNLMAGQPTPPIKPPHG